MFSERNAVGDVDVRNFDRVANVIKTFAPEAIINAVGLVKQRPNAKSSGSRSRSTRCCRISCATCARMSAPGWFTSAPIACSRAGRATTPRLTCPMPSTSTGARSSSARSISRRASRFAHRSSASSSGSRQPHRVVPRAARHDQGLPPRHLHRPHDVEMAGWWTGCSSSTDLHGLWHVASSPISKYDLLVNLANTLGRTDIEIVPDDTFECDRSLQADAFHAATAYQPPSWDDMLAELAGQIRRRKHARDALKLRSPRSLVANSRSHRQAHSRHGRHRLARTGPRPTPAVRRARHAEEVIVLSRDEAKQHEMRLSYLHREGSTDEVIYHNFSRLLEFRIGDVRSYADVCGARARRRHRLQRGRAEAGAGLRVLPGAGGADQLPGRGEHRSRHPRRSVPVETVVGISTDKACKPVNVMGMTKAIAERIFIAANVLNPRTRFVCVRYGNVLASRGSVIPLFHQQIKKGGPVTMTAPTMTRFLMTLEQAVDTVFEAVEHAAPGEIFIPRAPSANVMDIARALIESRPVEIKVTEVRPGEKEHEILVSEEECRHTFQHGDYYVIAPMLPELRKHRVHERPAAQPRVQLGGRARDFEDTAALLRTHRLMVDADQTPGAELLR